MKVSIKIKENKCEIDLSKPLDISIPLKNSEQNPIAWNQVNPIIEPVVDGDFPVKLLM